LNPSVHPSPATGEPEFLPVNACLRPLCACDGMAIVTVEGMGSSSGSGSGSGSGKAGPHPIQERLAKGNGTQCGFCTPGWVTNCYGLLVQQQQRQQPLTEAEVGLNGRCWHGNNLWNPRQERS
jgi:xanthine dehydrogenase iron-sulfur cluster and FAD-binding subunit A